MRGILSLFLGGAVNNEDETTLIHRKRSTFPLKKGEGMKREGVCLPLRTAQDFSTRSVASLLPSVEMTKVEHPRKPFVPARPPRCLYTPVEFSKNLLTN